MEIGLFLGLFFVFITMVYVVLAIFLPEWVGITGKVAKAKLAEHKSEIPEKQE